MTINKRKNETSFQLENDIIIKLDQQDIINNNIDKIKKKNPSLMLSNIFLPTGKIYKIMKVLEKGRQSSFLYYKILNILILIYVFSISYIMIETHHNL